MSTISEPKATDNYSTMFKSQPKQDSFSDATGKKRPSLAIFQFIKKQNKPQTEKKSDDDKSCTSIHYRGIDSNCN